MAIWIWIIAACMLSYLALGRNKVSFEHLIWLLLPIDMYGISVAGATIKPYMMFCFLLFVRLLLMRREKLVLNGMIYMSGLISVAVVLVNLLNNNTSSAPKAALMLVIVWGCSVVYLLNCGKSTASDIPNVMVAAGIGYGIVFIVGYLIMNLGLDIPGIVAEDRFSGGFMMNTANVHNGEFVSLYRLRGFTLDPNTMIGTFTFCAVGCLLRILDGRGGGREWMGLIISALCVLMSNSRMGVLCFIILAFAAFVIGYRLAGTRMRNAIKLMSLFLIGVTVITLIATDLFQHFLSLIGEMYNNRSGLNDKYGRFTIWRNAIAVLFSHNPLLGTGMGQMRNLTEAARDCHNTWLAMICDNGLIVGSLLVLHFVYAMLVGIGKARNNTLASHRELLWSLVIGTLTVMVSLISVDSLTYSYLWFGASLLLFVRSYQTDG